MKRPRPRIPTVAHGLVAIVVGVCLAAPAGAAWSPFKKKSYPDGHQVEITGVVTDNGGQPIEDLLIMLEGSRKSFKATKMRYEKDNPVKVSARTDARGEYRLSWKWHRYYNHFDLTAIVPYLAAGGSEAVETLATLELDDRIRQGSPVVASLTLSDRAFLDSIRGFIAALDTGDEQEVYQEMGKPDKIETLRFPDRVEQSWWYFNQGKTYRFRDGALEQIVDFDPVRQFPR